MENEYLELSPEKGKLATQLWLERQPPGAGGEGGARIPVCSVSEF